MDNIIFNKDINAQLDKVIPYNPQTGLRDSILHKYEISLSDSEKANLRQFLEVQEVHQPSSQLSDKDLIALCPSRYVCWKRVWHKRRYLFFRAGYVLVA